jgi:methionine sulfoxide reductase catalytic subunit
MTTAPERVPTHDPMAADLTPAGASIQLDDWDRYIPPRRPIVPHIRIGERWISVLWAALPIGLGVIILIAIAQSLREFPAVEAFIQRYPGVAQAQPAVPGFPGWMRLQHFLNMFFMYFIMRAGIQILADHPRLYWNGDCTPGTEWFRFSHPVPTYRIWTAKDDGVTLPGWLGIPGLRHSIGLGRWWHFSVNLLWTLNGVAFFVLLFVTGQWKRSSHSPGMSFPTRCRPQSNTRR